jgi:hypothetical protein
MSILYAAHALLRLCEGDGNAPVCFILSSDEEISLRKLYAAEPQPSKYLPGIFGVPTVVSNNVSKMFLVAMTEYGPVTAY